MFNDNYIYNGPHTPLVVNFIRYSMVYHGKFFFSYRIIQTNNSCVFRISISFILKCFLALGIKNTILLFGRFNILLTSMQHHTGFITYGSITCFNIFIILLMQKLSWMLFLMCFLVYINFPLFGGDPSLPLIYDCILCTFKRGYLIEFTICCSEFILCYIFRSLITHFFNNTLAWVPFVCGVLLLVL